MAREWNRWIVGVPDAALASNAPEPRGGTGCANAVQEPGSAPLDPAARPHAERRIHFDQRMLGSSDADTPALLRKRCLNLAVDRSVRRLVRPDCSDKTVQAGAVAGTALSITSGNWRRLTNYPACGRRILGETFLGKLDVMGQRNPLHSRQCLPFPPLFANYPERMGRNRYELGSSQRKSNRSVIAASRSILTTSDRDNDSLP